MMRSATTPLVLLLLQLALSSSPATSICVPRTPATTPASLPFPHSIPTPPPPLSRATTPPSPPAPTIASTTTSSPLYTTLSNPDDSSLGNILKSFCSHTDFSDLCLKSLMEAAPTFKSANNATILAALMKAVDAKAHEARAFAQKLAADTTFDARTRELLHDCIDLYDDALDNLESANEAIRAQDAGTRDSMLSAIISNIGTCEDGFQEFTIKSPLATWSQTLQDMTDNCLAIVNLSKPQEDY